MSHVGLCFINLHLTEGGPSLKPGLAVPAQNNSKTALVVKIPGPEPKLVSESFRKTSWDFICQATEIQPGWIDWIEISVDDTIMPSEAFKEIYKKRQTGLRI